jgi:hypothetical protein
VVPEGGRHWLGSELDIVQEYVTLGAVMRRILVCYTGAMGDDVARIGLGGRYAQREPYERDAGDGLKGPKIWNMDHC